MTKVEGEKDTEVRRQRVPGEESRRKTSFEESKRKEKAVTVTTQESSDGIREKAMRTAGIEELETGSSTMNRPLLAASQHCGETQV